MIRKKVKHIYFKSFIDNADIINTHNYFTSYSEFFIKEISNLKNEKIKEKYYDLLDFSDRIIHTRIIDMKFQETIEFINANYNSKMAICLNNDDIAIFEKYLAIQIF